MSGPERRIVVLTVEATGAGEFYAIIRGFESATHMWPVVESGQRIWESDSGVHAFEERHIFQTEDEAHSYLRDWKNLRSFFDEPARNRSA